MNTFKIRTGRRFVALLLVFAGLAFNGQSWRDAQRDGEGFIPSFLFRPITKVLPPCRTEDSNWCYWDAARRGEGEGKGHGESFVTVADVTFIFD